MKSYEEQKLRRKDMEPVFNQLQRHGDQINELACAVRALAAASGYAVVKKDGVPRLVKSDCIIGAERDDDAL